MILKREKHFISLIDVFKAYHECCRNKRNKLDCMEFHLDYEQKLIKLWEEINTGMYKIKPSAIFIVDKPVKREICAANFRDRIVHHLIVMKLVDLFEKEFIYDSYSCRANKGTHFGINRLDWSIKKATVNYEKKAYVLKLDISGYFMSINRDILLDKLFTFLEKKYLYNDRVIFFELCRLIIKNDVTKNYFFKSPSYKWRDLPRSKSVFGTKSNCSLPLGNFTSQVFSNFYLNDFDHFVKEELGIKYYGRYVDDFYLVSNSKEQLKDCIPKIKSYLKINLDLDVHPKKIYFEEIDKGVEFLGGYVLPRRIYITPRVKGNFYLAINSVNKILEKDELTFADKVFIRQKLNSYLGLLSHYNTYRLRRKFLFLLNSNFGKYFIFNDALKKVSLHSLLLEEG